MKVSASIYSYEKSKSLADIVRDLDTLSIDYLHIDCNDDLSVFEDIRQIRSLTSTPVDLHIISSEPEKFYAPICEFAIESVQFQYEQLKSVIFPPDNGITQYGLGLMSETPVSVFDNFTHFDFVLFMTTTPGVSGGTFNQANFHKIRQFRQKYQSKKICVDGGVNAEVGFILRNMGVSRVVCGSYLANHRSAKQALRDLRINDIESRFQVRDVMMQREEIPVLDEADATLPMVLQTIEDYHLGFVFFADNDGHLSGIASNADIRRGLLKHMNDLSQTRLSDVINRHPFVISDDLTIREMLQQVHEQNFIVSFIPVINAQRSPVGAITFFNLIRSEM